MFKFLRNYFPYEYFDSVFDIDYKKLYEHGCRALIFDIDNTLVHHGDDADEKVESLFRSLYDMGFQTVFLSDNTEERVQRFNRNIGSPCIANAGKPQTQGYYRALQELSIDKDNVICIGDQIFKDVLGANKSGLKNILVRFIKLDNEKRIGKKRYVEFLILWLYRKSKYKHRLGDISVHQSENQK